MCTTVYSISFDIIDVPFQKSNTVYRSRRVKCDEGKPKCSRCLRSGFECDGYSVPQRRKNVLLPKLYELSSTQQAVFIQFPKTGVYIQPSANLQFDTDIEHQHFMIFQTMTAPELTGYFDSSVWNRKVLQACHDQEYARHAVVALGAAWKARDISHSPPTGFPLGPKSSQEAKTLYAFALKEYDRAIQFMRNIPKQQYPDRLRNALLSSLLTTCFESYMGNQELALSQAELGVDVLLGWGNECQQAPVDDWTSVKKLEQR
jgi:Fungal Zn(2)-Cys(6) binuclear cluster domain